ncbi:beta-mannosidase [Rhodococcus sp. HM1]|uniref:beta-mannosidase n=1 Tax=Rhodococcus sp. HM1 TaxID=2937759 RepID=UPI00200A2FFC|nr:beta-mannosidase [Rhodococcus sp. HM1]MCK8675262.1 beta-mannosidase [Rhodococcus sp. HM1]
MRTGAIFLATVLSVVLAVAVCAATSSTTPVSRVGVSGNGLTLDGVPWWPTGLDAYQLATHWSVNRGCGAEVDLDAYFMSRPPGSVTRFNAFQQLAVNKSTGRIDFGPIDAVFAAAERHGSLVIPVLAGQDGACEDERYKDRDWYRSGWTVPGSASLSYRDWVSTAVSRWGASPAIAAWEPIGEPEAGICHDAGCSPQQRSCPDDSAQVLRDWHDAVGALIRTSDPVHPITAGLLGGDQCGTAGPGYALVADSPYVDFVQYHDYDDAAFLPQRLAQTSKPLVVTELGIHAGSCLPLQERADRIGARIDSYAELGAAGALLWAFVPDPRPEQCTYDIGPDDPVLAIPQLN